MVGLLTKNLSCLAFFICLFVGVNSISINPTKVATDLFRVLGIKNVNVNQCIVSGTGVATSFRDFEQELQGGNYNQAVNSLSEAISFLSSSFSGCAVKEVNLKLDALAASIKFANIQTSGLDNTVNVVIGTTNVINNLQSIAQSVSTANSTGVAVAMNGLLSSWTMVTGGCGSNKACHFVDGILKIFQEVSGDYSSCSSATLNVISGLQSAASSFESGRYKTAITRFASVLDVISNSLMQQACGVERIGTLIGQLSPKLQKAVVKIQSNGAVTIMVDSANIYDSLYLAVKAIKRGDYDSLGAATGQLLRQLRTSKCSNGACAVLEGILASVQLESANFDQCMAAAETEWSALKVAIGNIAGGGSSRSIVNGIRQLGSVIVGLANEVTACNIPQLGQIANTMLTKLNMVGNTVATTIGNDMTILANGADITLLINKAIGDYSNKNYHTFGTDLGNLAQLLGASNECNSIACKVIEGLLSGLGVGYQNLKTCESGIRQAESAFILAAQLFEGQHYSSSVKSFASGLNIASEAVNGCGLQQEIGFVIQEANVFGLANTTTSALGNAVAFLVHGTDFYQEVYGAVKDVKSHDWRGAGGNLQKIMSQLQSWTEEYGCTSNGCYVVIGMMQFLGDISGSIQECGGDFNSAINDFTYAYGNFTGGNQGAFAFSQSSDDVRHGVKSLGFGVEAIGDAVSDCDLQQLSQILLELASKLALSPDIAAVEEVLHVLIEGVRIDKEVGAAMVDWSNSDYPKFGYDVVKLAINLLD